MDEMSFLINEDEAGIFDDDSDENKQHGDVEEEEVVEKQYDVNSWPKEEEEPTGFSFKGKIQTFVKSVESVKILMKKGVHKQMEKLEFRFLILEKFLMEQNLMLKYRRIKIEV